MDPSATCECGTEAQTSGQVVLESPIHQPILGLHGLTVLDDETIMTAQHLPLGPVQVSGALKQLAQTTTTEGCKHFFGKFQGI